MHADDMFEPTVKQRKHLLYRRDGLLTPPPVEIDIEAVAARARACAQHYGLAMLRLGERDPRGRALPERPGEIADLPVEVAAALLTTRTELPYHLTAAQRRHALDDAAALLDHWTSTRGLGFAAETMLRAVTGPLFPAAASWHSHSEPGNLRHVLGLLRNRLAACAAAELRSVLAVFEEYRARGRHERVVTSYLLPSQRDWVAADIAEAIAADARAHRRLLVDAATEVEQLRWLNQGFNSVWTPAEGAAIAVPPTAITVVDGVGFAVVEVLADWFDHWEMTQPLRIAIADALAVIPTDAAFGALTARSGLPPAMNALRQAAQRFPRRALRLLDPTAHSDVLREHLHGYAELARESVAALPAATADFIATELGRVAAAAVDPEAAPAILRDPPWRNRARGKPTVAAGLVPPTEVYCSWLPGEREEWRSLVRADQYHEVEQVLRRPADWSLSGHELGALVVMGPERALPLLRTTRLRSLFGRTDELRAAVAAFEVAVYPLVLAAARDNPRDAETAILPYAATELVDLAIARLDRRTMRPAALRYLRRHAGFTARVLIPRAVGSVATNRRLACRVLRLLDGLGHGDEIRAVAAKYGALAEQAVEEVLDADPLTVLPTRMPAIPAWVNLAALPTVRTAAGEPLSAEAVENLLTMLMLADPGEPYAGVAQVYPLCDAATLADLAWELFAQWQRAGAPTRHSWVYEALGSFGDDETVAALLDHVRAHRSDPRSVSALDAFVAIGSDAALLALKYIGEKVKTKRVREGAQERIEAVADRLALTADQLADRLVPDLGLGPDGTTTLDFGPRRFVASFDDQLRPTITTAEGAAVKSLPKPGAKDDTERAEQAHKTFRALKKNARAVAVDQIRRLERAMVAQRRFTGHELRTLFIAHPLRWHVTRRLVWGVYDNDTLTGTFRIAEDRTSADSRDETFPLADDAVLGVAHPLQFADEIEAWGEIFSDYELLQPFPQIARETYTVPEELLSATEILCAGEKVEGPRFLGLAARGWLPPETGDGGYIYEFEKPLPHGRFLRISTSPGLAAYDPSAEQTFGVRLRRTRSGRGEANFAELDAITVSEILRDIAWLNGESH
ncbi:DUF4132 domain-containing protein [Nocardia sp. NPDC050406]|uniref:DUF4132 domain-containing protein n=1 Tax=Nocardia sp. NPDC050406 TaxID=3364318 RepID=UPI0037AEFBA0